VRVNCAYGTHCSPAHKRTHSPSATNDHYALDLVRLAPGNGFDKSVVAVAPGVVRYAGWTTRGFSPYGKVVYLEHAYRDSEGHRYQTLYAHLNRVKVSKGQRVRAGEAIGTLGGSSKGRLGKLGFHLHFAMYQDARPVLGGGRAVLPEPLGRFASLQPGTQFVSCGKTEPDRVALVPYPPLAFGGLLDP
jgi:murein DD-endopeptidase MepM/ murein hydrolase activator NlpD